MAPPGEAAERARRFLKELEGRNAPAFRLIHQQYLAAHAALEADIDRVYLRRLQGKIDDATLAAILERKQALLDVIEKRMNEYADAVGRATNGLVKTSAKAGLEHGAGQLQAWGIAQGVGVDEHALAALMAQTNPTRNYIQAIPEMAKARAERILTQALVLGWNPKRIAQELAGVAGIARARAEVIARTEMMRAYREGNRAQWANLGGDGPPLVHGWVWACTPSVRTCPICYALSGSFHPITESMTSHPNCRCTMIPVPTNYAASLSQYQLKPFVPQGEDQLRLLPAEDQKRILGPTRYDAFKNGASLKHMIEEHWDPVFGTQHRLKKLPKAPSKVKAPAVAGQMRRASGSSVPGGLTRDENNALDRYTSSSSALNGGLRQNPGMGASAFQPHYYEAEQVVHFDAMLERTASPVEREVFRGASAHHYGNLDIGDEIIDHGYMSTSLDPKVADNFSGDLMLRIMVPEGSRGIDVNATTTSGYHPGEAEFILPRGSRFVVIGREYKPRLDYAGRPIGQPQLWVTVGLLTP